MQISELYITKVGEDTQVLCYLCYQWQITPLNHDPNVAAPPMGAFFLQHIFKTDYL